MLTQRALLLRSTLDNTPGSEERIRYIDALLGEMFDNCKPTPEEFDTVFDGLDLTEQQKAGMVSIIDYGSEAAPEPVAEVAEDQDDNDTEDVESHGSDEWEEFTEAHDELQEILATQEAIEPIVIPEVTELVSVEAD
jgi:hypothetical protein